MIEAKLSKSGRTLTISTGKLTTHYDISVLDPDLDVAKKAFRLKKDDGTFWDAALMTFGWECTCADWVFSGGESKCKHLLGLEQVGLIKKGH